MIKGAQKARVESKNPLEIARRVLTIEADAVRGLLGRLDEKFAAAVQLVAQRKGRVVVSGMGKSGHIARKIASTLASTGTPAYFVHPAEASHGDLGMILDRDVVRRCVRGADAVIHAATLHKPHVATHPRQAFVDTNVTGTLNLLEEAAAAGVAAFVFTSTTSAFGRALTPPPGAPAAWVTEDVRPVPRNIYGVTKVAAENLCELFHRLHRLPCLVLRTSRFFPEPDDDHPQSTLFDDSDFAAGAPANGDPDGAGAASG